MNLLRILIPHLHLITDDDDDDHGAILQCTFFTPLEDPSLQEPRLSAFFGTSSRASQPGGLRFRSGEEVMEVEEERDAMQCEEDISDIIMPTRRRIVSDEEHDPEQDWMEGQICRMEGTNYGQAFHHYATSEEEVPPDGDWSPEGSDLDSAQEEDPDEWGQIYAVQGEERENDDPENGSNGSGPSEAHTERNTEGVYRGWGKGGSVCVHIRSPWKDTRTLSYPCSQSGMSTDNATRSEPRRL